MKDTVEKRAVKIAAQVMQAAGLCRHDSPLQCARYMTNEIVCRNCIERWLISKAKAELKKEEI